MKKRRNEWHDPMQETPTGKQVLKHLHDKDIMRRVRDAVGNLRMKQIQANMAKQKVRDNVTKLISGRSRLKAIGMAGHEVRGNYPGDYAVIPEAVKENILVIDKAIADKCVEYRALTEAIYDAKQKESAIEKEVGNRFRFAQVTQDLPVAMCLIELDAQFIATVTGLDILDHDVRRFILNTLDFTQIGAGLWPPGEMPDTAPYMDQPFISFSNQFVPPAIRRADSITPIDDPNGYMYELNPVIPLPNDYMEAMEEGAYMAREAFDFTVGVPGGNSKSCARARAVVAQGMMIDEEYDPGVGAAVWAADGEAKISGRNMLLAHPLEFPPPSWEGPAGNTKAGDVHLPPLQHSVDEWGIPGDGYGDIPEQQVAVEQLAEQSGSTYAEADAARDAFFYARNTALPSGRNPQRKSRNHYNIMPSDSAAGATEGVSPNPPAVVEQAISADPVNTVKQDELMDAVNTANDSAIEASLPPMLAAVPFTQTEFGKLAMLGAAIFGVIYILKD